MFWEQDNNTDALMLFLYLLCEAGWSKGVGSKGATGKLVPTISILIGNPSSWTLLNLLMAVSASNRR